MTDNHRKTFVKRSRNTIVIIAMILFALVLIVQHKTVKTINCTPDIIKQKPDIIMLGAWWCRYCYRAKQYFQKNHINYCEYDMENTTTGKQLYAENGGGAIPLLLIGQYRLRGFDPAMIQAALKQTPPFNTSH